MLAKVALSLGLLFAGAQAQQAVNCNYQQLVCGSTLLVAPFSMFCRLISTTPDLKCAKSLHSLHHRPAHSGCE